MINVKDGAVFRCLKKEIYNVFPVLDSVWANHGKTCTITSAHDSTHMTTSLHYRDLALDIRTHDLDPRTIQIIMDELRHKLGADYDIIWEYPGQPSSHLHLEFDPD